MELAEQAEAALAEERDPAALLARLKTARSRLAAGRAELARIADPNLSEQCRQRLVQAGKALQKVISSFLIQPEL